MNMRVPTQGCPLFEWALRPLAWSSGASCGWSPVNPDDIVRGMKPISLSVSEADYEAFRRAAKEQGRSIAQLIREAMAFFRANRLERRQRLTELPVLPGHRPTGALPSRSELYDDIFDSEEERQ